MDIWTVYFRSYWSYKNAFIWTEYVINIHSISSLDEQVWIQTFHINLYFNSSQYYPTLDQTLAIKLSLHLICFIIRMYSCNINPHLVNLWFLFWMLLINVTVLWPVNTTNRWNVHQNAVFFSILDYFFWSLSNVLEKIAIRQIYVILTFLEQNCTNTYITCIHC